MSGVDTTETRDGTDVVLLPGGHNGNEEWYERSPVPEVLRRGPLHTSRCILGTNTAQCREMLRAPKDGTTPLLYRGNSFHSPCLFLLTSLAIRTSLSLSLSSSCAALSPTPAARPISAQKESGFARSSEEIDRSASTCRGGAIFGR